ncbi:MAG: cbb3-type cytochrome c oxidase subunit I [Deltaproteobacteria bacterium]|jgi:nitric oxide reductase subunit B|nr:cbb3-type cytochrome c oxidase subunit I [Deltaproteobacteria bacterium]MCL5879954.1 cbb3-type cytochrome c oxidase subunit I [Deltaproteobacteria bacterium]MDA8304355.1 cbb3-type cytochrome c oxidase subunit I [Deltaproteobacteria bacterium]
MNDFINLNSKAVNKFLKITLSISIIVLVGILVYGTFKVYYGAPPIPKTVVDKSGKILFTGKDIVAGKARFQEFDLMDYGSIYGNGAYFGPDFTDQYLHREVKYYRQFEAKKLYKKKYAALSPRDKDYIDNLVVSKIKKNRFDAATGVLTYTAGEAYAFKKIKKRLESLYIKGNPQLGIGRNLVASAPDVVKIAYFYSWASWSASTLRPGVDHTYTNNWPFNRGAGNTPPTYLYTWTFASISVFIALAGLVIWFFLSYIAPGWQEAPALLEDWKPADLNFKISHAMKKSAKFFFLGVFLLGLQIIAGMLLAHYYAERTSFFGIHTLTALPFNIVKAWHIQLAILFIASTWLGAGIFVSKYIGGGKDPKWQSFMIDFLWWALLVDGVAALVGMYLGAKGYFHNGLWFFLGNQGLEYLQLGRINQIIVFVGLLLWVVILYRALRPHFIKNTDKWSIERLLLISAATIGIMYVFGMFPLAWILKNWTITDFWRWWVVHLWVEGTFEFFAVAVIGYFFLSQGLVKREVIENTLILEILLIFIGGIVGTGHHFYFIGDASIWIALGSMFSFLEVIPLLLLTMQAVYEKNVLIKAGKEFPQGLSFKYLEASTFWNFIGAGVFGSLINTPLMNYYEHGQYLTINHGHTALFGVFGLLGIALSYYVLRMIVEPSKWTDGAGRIALWCFNIGMILWVILNFLPEGFMQFAASVKHGYWYSRSIYFYDKTDFWLWMRSPGDLVFTIGVLVLFIDITKKLFQIKKSSNGQN